MLLYISGFILFFWGGGVGWAPGRAAILLHFGGSYGQKAFLLVVNSARDGEVSAHHGFTCEGLFDNRTDEELVSWSFQTSSLRCLLRNAVCQLASNV